MHINISIASFSFVFTGALLTILLQKYRAKNRTLFTPDEFLLGGKQLGRLSVLNLFLSASFGITSFFYAVLLGYTIGFWGFIMQLAWSVGFLLLVPFTKKIKSGNSLHDFLGKYFGSTTGLISAICYLASILFLMAWEVRIGENALSKTIVSPDSTDNLRGQSFGIFVVTIIVFVVVCYTMVGGLKGNATVDKFLNLLKVSCILLLVILLSSNFISFSQISFSKAMFPSFSAIMEHISIWGLITNIILNLFTQFTDSNCWQNIIVGSDKQNSKWNLKAGGVLIFLTIGFLGTLIGILIAGVPTINADTILIAPLTILKDHTVSVGILLVILITACMMSLLNSTLLISARVFSIDILQFRSNSNFIPLKASQPQNLLPVKISLVVISIVSIGGINYLISLTTLNLFELIYIFAVCPFSYFGAVMFAFLTKRRSRKMHVAVLLSLIIGLGCVAVGILTNIKFLLDGAASFTLLASFFLAHFFSNKNLTLENQSNSKVFTRIRLRKINRLAIN